jgi:hypothetical protein
MAISSALGSSALLPAGLGFRNKIINGDFGINQRAFTSTTTSTTYGFDRWRSFHFGNTTYSAQTFTAGNEIPGQEPINFARIVTVSQASDISYASLQQRIEDVRTCAGQTVTVSFWAKSGSGTPQVRVGLSQNFGTGGSSSVGALSSLFTLSTGWQRFTANITLPSISGKTIGSSSFLEFQLWVSASSGLNIVPLQNNTFDFWGVQLEQNYQPTPFEQRPYGVELALCQRYYQRLLGWSVLCSSSVGADGTTGLPVEMRVAPVATMSAAPVLTDTVANYTGSSTAISAYYNTVRSVRIIWNTFTGLTTLRMAFVSHLSGVLICDSEL